MLCAACATCCDFQAGALGGLTVATLVAPLDTIKVRLQAKVDDGVQSRSTMASVFTVRDAMVVLWVLVCVQVPVT